MDEFKNILASFGKYIAKQRKESGGITKEEVALSIRKYRAEHDNMTIEELARELEIPRMQIYRWEHARNKPSKPMLDLLKKKGIMLE